MSLARNPSMMYAVAGMQTQPFEKMRVHSHVRVPDDAADYGGRNSYSAPPDARARRSALYIPMSAALVVIGLVACVMLVLYLIAVSERSTLSKARQDAFDDIQSIQTQMIELRVEIAQAQDSAVICYRAAQTLGMVTKQGVETIEIFAPDTRPASAGHSLPRTGSIASLGR